MSNVATRELFFQKRERARKLIDAPELGAGVKVLIQQPSALERGQLETSLRDSKGGTKLQRLAQIRERVAVLCCINEDGTKLFSEGDVQLLGQLPASLLERIVREYQEMSLTDDADLETLAGN